MENHASTTQWVDKLKSVEMFGKVVIKIDLGQNTLMMNSKQIDIKVGGNKVKVSMFDFMQAFKDMLDTGAFELDQIDAEVFDIENKLEVIGNQNDYLTETLNEIRGGC